MVIKTIIGFENYSVDENGVVYGIVAEQLKVSFDKRGYHKVWLYNKGKRTEKYIHRLVAEHFVYGDKSLSVNHIDGDKNNNHYSNLEWLSNADNIRHSFYTGLRKKENMGKTKGACRGIKKHTLEKAIALIKSGKSARSVAISLNIKIKTLQYQYLKNYKYITV